MILALFGLHALWLASAPYRMKGNPLQYFHDDFFYYLVIAKNMATGHGSTFNGIVSTNGYQPLWQWVLAGEQLFSPTLPQTQLFISAASIISSTIVVWLCYRLLKSFSLSDIPAALFAVFIGSIAIKLCVGGMETILAIPSMFWLLWLMRNDPFRNPKTLLQLGFVFSLITLSRLDAGMFAALLIGGQLCLPEVRKALTLQKIAAFLCGLIPLAIYLVTNFVFFGGLLPVSGVAKQLKRSFVPSPSTVKSLFTSNHFYTGLLILCLVALLLLVGWKKLKLSKSEKLFLGACLSFPFIYYAILSLRSDWPVWAWYFYPLPVAITAAVCVLKDQFRFSRANIYVRGALALAVAIRLLASKGYSMEATIPDEAIALSKFASTHPGIYAMGDRAGSVGYLLHNPLVQTEGLVMDRAFLKNIREERPLLQVLRSYNVRYYAVSISWPVVTPLRVREPVQAGKDSPKMRGELQHAPIFQYDNDEFHTVVFDLNLEPGYKA